MKRKNSVFVTVLRKKIFNFKIDTSYENRVTRCNKDEWRSVHELKIIEGYFRHFFLKKNIKYLK